MYWSVPIVLTLVVFLVLRWYWKKGHIAETFRGKNVVICGASTGIGEQLAYRYSKQGANVMLVARREEMLKNVVGNCSSLGASSASYITADLSTTEGAKRVTEVSRNLFLSERMLVLTGQSK